MENQSRNASAGESQSRSRPYAARGSRDQCRLTFEFETQAACFNQSFIASRYSMIPFRE